MRQIQTDELDFDGIKENIKTFLRGQTQFDSYDFDGSAMSMLLDILAYNTHYNMLYTNMALNESFIDSASKRASIISHAKILGYTPRSVKSSRATLSITVTLPVNEEPVVLTLPKGTIFATGVGETPFVFSTITDYTTTRADGVYSFSAVEVIEGTPVSKSFNVIPSTEFIVPDLNVDISTLNVYVKNAAEVGSVLEKYTQIQDALRIRGTDNIYFLKQRDDLFYEVSFGNGAIGKAVVPGSSVRLDYLLSNGEISNGANIFTYQSGWRNDITLAITTTRAAYGGAPEEDIEEIRYNAPRAYVAQNRALTAADYENLLKAKYSNIETLAVWGGQENIPKVFGKVFIAAKPYGRDTFSTEEKNDMTYSLLLKRGVVSITPEFIDPVYMQVEIVCNVYYNNNRTRYTPNELETFVRNSISSYGATLNKFDSVFRHSRLTAAIDNASDYITSNSSTMKVRIPVEPVYNAVAEYSFITNNPFAKVSGGGFYSTRFYTPLYTDRCYIKDDGLGALFLVTEDLNGIPTVRSQIGTIDYNAGSFSIPRLTISTMHDDAVEFVFIPAANDIVSNRNLIVSLRNDLVTVNMIADKIASGEASGGNNYTFSNVR